MFAKYEIPYRAIDLDSVAYQEGDRGGKIRAVLKDRYDVRTIPQVFVGGEFVGGATETFDSLKEGDFQKLLERNSVNYNATVTDDPYSFLPDWLHPR